MRLTVRRTLVAILLVIAGTTGCGVRQGDSGEVTVKPGQHGRTFGDAMHPLSTKPWTAADLTVTSGGTPPPWGELTRTRWDTPGAFTHSLRPRAISSLSEGHPDAAGAIDGAAYVGTDGSLKNADVRFTITARRFAVVYPGNQDVDAMVWLDSRPIAGHPIDSTGPARGATTNWIAITLPERRTVTVRFAGPLGFTGVDAPASERAVIKAWTPAVTLGVLSDSYYDVCMQKGCMSRNAAPELSTLTGFRVWNMAEAGTGYLNPGHRAAAGSPSPFGSIRRLRTVATAPIDALLVGGSINDALMPPGAYAATVNRLLDQIQMVRPDLPVVLLGIEPLGGGYESGYWRKRGEAMTAVLRSMVAQHRNVVGFIDPFTTPWLSGTGSIVKPAGDGNDDLYIGSDGIHPSVAGTRYYQRRVTKALRQIPFPAQHAASSTTH